MNMLLAIPETVLIMAFPYTAGVINLVKAGIESSMKGKGDQLALLKSGDKSLEDVLKALEIDGGQSSSVIGGLLNIIESLNKMDTLDYEELEAHKDFLYSRFGVDLMKTNGAITDQRLSDIKRNHVLGQINRDGLRAVMGDEIVSSLKILFKEEKFFTIESVGLKLDGALKWDKDVYSRYQDNKNEVDKAIFELLDKGYDFQAVISDPKKIETYGLAEEIIDKRLKKVSGDHKDSIKDYFVGEVSK